MLGFAGLPGGYPKRVIEGLKKGEEFIKTGSAYANIQETKPQVSCSLKLVGGLVLTDAHLDCSHWTDRCALYLSKRAKVSNMTSQIALPVSWLGSERSYMLGQIIILGHQKS